jgi:hypothetical protein
MVLHRPVELEGLSVGRGSFLVSFCEHDIQSSVFPNKDVLMISLVVGRLRVQADKPSDQDCQE